MSTKGKAESFVEMRGSLTIPDMIAGKSAYEIAVMNGFQGTEEEWLASLKGDKGDTVVINPDGSADFVKETDPTVPAWAKAETKPSYTAAEVGARPNTWTPTAADIGLKTENWTLTYEDGTVETKVVYVG